MRLASPRCTPVLTTAARLSGFPPARNMPDFTYDPPVPPRPTDQPFLQRIDLRENGKIVATLHWHAPAGDEGVVQLLDLTVVGELRRRGHGSTVLTAAIAQMKALSKSRRVPLRRLWLSLEQ